MTTISDHILQPSAAAQTDGYVVFTVVANVGADSAAFTTGTVVGPTRVKVDGNGAFSVDLTPNASIIPANTVYKVETFGGGMKVAPFYILVPASGTYTLQQVLTSPPPPLSPVPTATKVNIGAIVYIDPADNTYKFWNTITNTVGATTSTTDSAVVFNAAFTAIGKGLVGYYQDLSTKTTISPPSGCGIIGVGVGHTVGAGVTISAVSGHSGGPMVTMATTSITDVSIIHVSLNASTFSSRCIFGGGTDCDFVMVMCKGGNTDSASFGGVRSTVIDCDCGPPNAGAGQSMRIAGSDGIVAGGRAATVASGLSLLVDTATDGWQIDAFHSNGPNSAGNIKVDGDNIIFTNLYVDGIKSGDSFALGANAGLVSVTGGTLRNGAGGNSNPSIGNAFASASATSNLFLSNVVTEQGPGGGSLTNWVSAWSGTGNARCWISSCSFNVIGANSNFLTGFPNNVPNYDNLTSLNGNVLRRGITGSGVGTSPHTISVGGIAQDTVTGQSTTSSATYADLADGTGPSVRVYVGTSGTVKVRLACQLKNATTGNDTFMGVQVDANAATDGETVRTQAGSLVPGMWEVTITGLSNGAHDFLAKYKSPSATVATFANRRIIAEPV